MTKIDIQTQIFRTLITKVNLKNLFHDRTYKLITTSFHLKYLLQNYLLIKIFQTIIACKTIKQSFFHKENIYSTKYIKIASYLLYIIDN